jgi:hypothetical protein
LHGTKVISATARNVYAGLLLALLDGKVTGVIVIAASRMALIAIV